MKPRKIFKWARCNQWSDKTAEKSTFNFKGVQSVMPKSFYITDAEGNSLIALTSEDGRVGAKTTEKCRSHFA